jgi:hypothetical protein
MADQSQIDPRLFASASSVPPRSQQLYSSAPQQNTAHPYYLPEPAAQHHSHAQQPPQLSHLSQPAPLAGILDPALEHTSPTGPHDDNDDDDADDHPDHDGYVVPALAASRDDEAHRHSTPTTLRAAQVCFALAPGHARVECCWRQTPTRPHALTLG